MPRQNDDSISHQSAQRTIVDVTGTAGASAFPSLPQLQSPSTSLSTDNNNSDEHEPFVRRSQRLGAGKPPQRYGETNFVNGISSNITGFTQSYNRIC